MTSYVDSPSSAPTLQELRTPNGFPGGVPAESYGRGDLETTLRDLDVVFEVSDAFPSARGFPTDSPATA